MSGRGEPIVLGARPLGPEDVVAVARGRPVVLGDDARERMRRTRAVLVTAIERGDAIYGATRGVGALRTVTVAASEQAAFNRGLLVSHAVGHGPLASRAVVRAAMVVRAAGLALGFAGVRPEVADGLCAALNAGVTPDVHLIGSVGQADLSQMAEIGLALTGQTVDAGALADAGLRPLALESREAHAILNSNAFTVGGACLAVEEAGLAVRSLERSAALSYEALPGNVDALHPRIVEARPYPGDEAARAHLAGLLAGGTLADRERAPRNLQDPLCFKAVVQTHGAARDALGRLHDQLSVELASSGDSAFVIADEERAISTGGHEIAPVALAVDYARLALAGPATTASERIQRLLDGRFTDLPTGLRDSDDDPLDGLGVAGHGAASLVAEIRLLAAPVTLEHPTSSLAGGNEDRITLGPAGVSRLARMSRLVLRLAAVELLCAAQAVDLRGRTGELGAGTGRDHRLTRSLLPAGPLTIDSDARLAALAAALRDDAATERDDALVRDRETLIELSASPGPLAPQECARRARRAADALELGQLDRSGSGEAILLWRSTSSEAWLNLWWQPRDTGYHDHDGSGVGVHVIDGVARNESLMYPAARRVRRYASGESFWLSGDGIHRMEHDPGAITIHVYSPPIRSLGHYEIADGRLRRTPGAPDDPSPPSDDLLAAARSGRAGGD